jgi:hypothetical protein
MEPSRKTHSTILMLTILAFSLIAIGFLDARGVETFTGSFTDAHEPEQVYLENVYWEFGENETMKGRMAIKAFPEGTHNVTVRVEKSNGETEIHRGEVKID